MGKKKANQKLLMSYFIFSVEMLKLKDMLMKKNKPWTKCFPSMYEPLYRNYQKDGVLMSSTLFCDSFLKLTIIFCKAFS